MQAIVLRDSDLSHPLTQQWAVLAPSTPFNGWEVFKAWMDQKPRGGEPFVVLLADTLGKLVAVAPWCIQRDRFGIRHLTGIGGQDAWYHDPWILAPGRSERIAATIVETLRAHRRQWDALDLILRPQVSGALLAELGKLGMTFQDAVSWRQHQAIEMGDDWSAYWASRPQKLRETVGRKGKRLGGVPHRFLVATPAEAEGMWEALFEMQAKRMPHERDWTAYHEALRLFCRGANRQGALRLYALEINDRLAALELFVRHEDRVFELTRAIDDDFNYYSAGSVLTAWAMEHLHASGVRSMDPGPGHYGWKELLKTSEIATVDAHAAVRSSLPGLAWVSWTGWLVPRLKRSSMLKRLQRRSLPKPSPQPS